MTTLLDKTAWSGRIFNGSWIQPRGGTIDVLEPATGEVLASVGEPTVDDVARASGQAARSQRDWAATKPEERARVMRRAGAIWNENADEIIEWIVRETGSIGAKAQLELHMAAEICFAASALPGHPLGSALPSNEDHWSFSRRRPWAS